MTATWSDSLSDATRHEITQHSRNRVALALVLVFIPVWLLLVNVIIPSEPVDFHSRPAGRTIPVDANELGMISGAMNAVTLIIGFMMFTAVRRSADFDRRLVLAGFPRSALLLAKLLALLAAAGVVALYASLLLLLFWRPEQFALLLTSLSISGLTYGGIGIVLAMVFRTELAGMFLIIMISLVDVMVQNPIITPSSAGGGVTLLPTFGAMQTAVAAAFTEDLTLRYLLLGILWLAAAAAAGLYAFNHRTRDYNLDGKSTEPHQGTEAVTVLLTTRSDGTLQVSSSSGPILLCTRLTGSTPDCSRPD